MIDRYLLRIVVVLSFLLGPAVSGLSAQEREETYPKELLDVIMRGAGNPEALPSLSASYCSTDGPIDVYVEETLPSEGVGSVIWTVRINVGGNLEEPEPYFYHGIGETPNNGIRLYPDQLNPEHLDRTIMIEYSVRDTYGGPMGINKADYTHVLKSPIKFDLSIVGYETETEVEVCAGEMVDLTLSGSENG